MLHQAFEDHLRRVILPFWMGLKDDVHGGYVGLVDYDLTRHADSVKGCILNSRILWFFSACEKELGDTSLRPYADHAYAMLKRFWDDMHGGLYWSLNSGGTVADGTKHTYCQAFGVYALAAYYAVSRDENALSLCMKLFELIEARCVDDCGYLEAFDEDFKPVDNAKLSENGVMAKRTMNTLLHLLEAYSEFLAVTGNARVRERLRYILMTLLDKVYNPDKKRLEVFFDGQMNSILDLHSYGHDIEASWLMERALSVLGDSSLTAKAIPVLRSMVRHVYEEAFDGRCLYNECDRGIKDKTRVWWVQAEAVVGFYHAAHREERPEYFDSAEAIWQYIQDHFLDKRPGSEWFWSLDNHDQPVPKPIAEPWKCPYHNGRMCLEMIRGGRPATNAGLNPGL